MALFRNSRIIVVVICVLGFFPANSVYAVEAYVEAHGSQQYANINESGISAATSALLTFLITQSGYGVDLGVSSYGDGTTAISLPAGITIGSVITPVGGCGFTTTQFYNFTEGQYGIRVVPFVGNPACKWVAGDYIVHIRIDRSGYQGRDLGILTIK